MISEPRLDLREVDVIGGGCGVVGVSEVLCMLWVWCGVMEEPDEAWGEGGGCTGPCRCGRTWLSALCGAVRNGTGVPESSTLRGGE